MDSSDRREPTGAAAGGTVSLAGVPPTWQQAAVVAIVAAASVYVASEVLGWLLAKVRFLLDILSPLVVAFAIAYAFDPLVDRFEDRGWSRKAAIAFVLAVAIVSLGLLVVLVIPSVLEQGRELGPRLSEAWRSLAHRLEENLGGALTWLSERGLPVPGAELGLREAVERAASEIDWRRFGERVTNWLRQAADSGFAAFGFLLNVVLVPILTVYLLADIDIIKDRLAGLVPPRHRDRVLEPMREIDRALSGFVRGQLTVAAILGVLYMLGLWLSGTPLGLAIGFLAGALSFIPYLGLLLGLVPALMLTGLEHGFVSFNFLGVVLTFGVAQFLEGNFITPRIMGRAIGLHPVIVIVAIVVGGTIFGIVGMLLAVPAAATLVVLVRRAHAEYVRSEIYTADDGTGGDGPEGMSRAGPPDGSASEVEPDQRETQPTRRRGPEPTTEDPSNDDV